MIWTDMGAPGSPFPAWGGPAERLRHLLRYAVRAPSRHNSQPWLFEIEGPEARVHADPRRLLRVADPHGRGAAIACGAALENLCIAAAHHGHDMEVETSDPGRGGPLATARLLDRRPPTPTEEELFGAIPLRRTALAFDARPALPEELAALGAEVRPDARFRRVPRWLARPVAELVAEAAGIQWSSARFRAELAAWTRSRPCGRSDGLAADRPKGLSGPGGLLRKLLRRAGGRYGREVDRRCDERTRTLLLLSTRGDDPGDWLEAGRSMQRLLLRAAAGGLAVSPMNQAIEVPDVRRRLRRELGEPGWPQLLLRVGHGPRPPATPRRPVELVLRSFSSELAVEIDVPGEPARLARGA